MEKKNFTLYMRNFIFGTEDSLVSTVGLLAGIVSAGTPHREVVVSGIVLIFVEAFSMSVGSFLSERTTEESRPNYQQKKSKSLFAAIIMFFSYLLSGLIPLFPYLVISGGQAFWMSIIFSLVALFILGAVGAAILKTNILKSAIRMSAISGFAILLGVTVGTIIK